MDFSSIAGFSSMTGGGADVCAGADELVRLSPIPAIPAPNATIAIVQAIAALSIAAIERGKINGIINYYEYSSSATI